MANPALASDVALATASIPDYITIFIPLIINFIMIAFLSGRLTEKIKALESDLIKLQGNMDKMKDANDRTETHLHRVELVLSKIEARFDIFFATIAESSKCPMLKDGARSVHHVD